MSTPDPNDELAGTEQPFVAHLVELRDRLIKALIAVVVVAIVLFLWPGPGALYDILAAPLIATLPKGATLIATSVISPFLVPLKILLMAAFLIALPVVLYQAWAFIAPGLYSHEKRLVMPLVVSSTLLFFIGVAFCYFFVFGQVFAFIQSFAPKSITAAPDIEAYLSFVLSMFIAFGAAFEVPVAVVVLARMGIVTVAKLKEWRGYFIVVAFVVAAIITPPDVVSQLSLAIPMCLLYEVGIWAAQIFIRHTKAPEADASSATLPGPFDLLFSRFGVMFFDEPVPAFRHLHTVMAPTGRLAFVCWQMPADNPWAALPAQTARRIAGEAPKPDPHAPGPFAFGDRDRVSSILADAGFHDIACEGFTAPMYLGSSPRSAAEGAVRIGPASRVARDAGPEKLPAIIDAIEAALIPHKAADDSVSLPGKTWVVTASA